MTQIDATKGMKKFWGMLTVVLVSSLAIATHANAAEKVTTYKDEQGWKLQVDGEDFYVKGIVWGYTPRNENYSYNLWSKPDDFIRKVLDYDFGLMQAAGVNAIRSFASIPPKWVTYVYNEYGIMTAINPLMGRYGYTVGGRWIPNTDYSDPLTRATLKKDMLEIVNEYKDVSGVLMFAFGNESNYQLSWSSFEIENLPEGERNTEKARYLYSLFNEVMKAGKEIDPHHPFSIVNGDIQYIDLIAEYCVDMDILGSNVYRGVSFTDLWARVDEKLDRPVVFFEFGSDAFNAREFQEDQAAQAEVLHKQWLEMYNKSYGNGEEGNAIGGFVFEWRDEWWKYLQTENLDTQDNNASWSNQAYLFDWAEGKNNMNEEWFGITALGKRNSDGVYTARPRMAYDVLTEIWSMDPYALKKDSFNKSIKDINMDYLALKGEVRKLKSESKDEKQKLTFTGGSLIGELVLKGSEQDIDINGENGTEFEDGQMIFLDFGFQPNDKIDGQFTLNILGNVADKEPLEIQYGRRGLPLTIRSDLLVGEEFASREIVFNDRERIEVYDFNATIRGKNFDIEAFYHTPRFHWGYKGDFFGLLRETTDMEGQDIWNSKAPEGVEFTGKGAFEGLTVLAGPEVYWGANPKVMLKYDTKLGKTDVTFIHSEDIARQGESSSATAATARQSRQTTLYGKRVMTNGMTLELGGIISSIEEIDETFDRAVGGRVFTDQIEFEDTLGAKAKLSFPLFGSLAYVSAGYGGLVADGGNALRELGTQLPYSSQGNKQEYEAGVMMNFGYWMVFPRVLYRDNLVHANPTIEPSVTTIVQPTMTNSFLNPGITPRDTDSDPFAVLDSREARSAELIVTYDPTGATPFYDWDNDLREDAGFAFNVGLNYTAFPTATDASLFFFEPGGINASFGVGLPSEDVWSVSSRMIFNPDSNAKYIANIKAGSQQSTGDPNGGKRDFYELHGKAVLGGKHIISGYVKKDAWGPYDFHRQFNVTFPEQFQLDYSVILDGSGDQFGSTVGNATKIGIRALYRTNDENSPADEFLNGENDYIFQTVFYFNYLF